MKVNSHRTLPSLLATLVISGILTGCQTTRIADPTGFRQRYSPRVHSAGNPQVRMGTARPVVLPLQESGSSVQLPPTHSLSTTTSLDPEITLVPLDSTAPESGSGPRSYIVNKGDTLSGIARKAYGEGASWKTVYEANRHILDSPNELRPGMELVLP